MSTTLLKTLQAHVSELKGPFQLCWRIDTLDVKQLGEWQILARTKYTAISPGTELAAYMGDPPLRPGKVYPRLMGYCNVAEIQAVGNAVKDFAPGDLILTYQSHRSAFVCEAEDVILKLPPCDEERQALLSTTYLFHLGYDAILKLGTLKGQRIGILGLGALGLRAVSLSQCLGLEVVALSDQPELREKAAQLGADAYAKNILDDDPTHPLKDNLDAVINFSNQWEDHQLGMRLVKAGGKIGYIGFPGRTQPVPDFNPLASALFYDKQLTLQACGIRPEAEISENCRFLADAILSGALRADRIVSNILSWRELDSAYQALARREKGLLTFVLRWDE